MQEIKNARAKLDQKLGTKASTAPTLQPAKNKFTRVAIQEESEEDEEKATPAEGESFKVTKGGEVEEEAPKKLLIEEVKSTPTPTQPKKQEEKKTGDWWKKSDDSLNYDDFKKPTS